MNEEKLKSFFELGLGIFLYCVILHFFGITCPIKALTGVSCMGCGMTRAWLAALRLDFQKAFYYHPLFVVPLLVVIYSFAFHARTPTLIHKALVRTIIPLFIIVYFFRLFLCKGDIVVFHPQEGLIARMLLK